MNYKILITGIFCVGLSMLGTYKLGELKNLKETGHAIPTQSPLLSPTPTLTPTPTSTPTSEPTISPSPIATPQKDFEKVKAEALKSGIVLKEAKEGEFYNVHEAVKAGNGLLALEGIRADYNYANPSTYFAIVDFSIFNLNSNSYYSLSSNFSLQDEEGYTYNPYLAYSTRGALGGEIFPNNMKRGEIAFAVPPKTFFHLIFRTNDKNVRTIKFNVDTSKYFNGLR